MRNNAIQFFVALLFMGFTGMLLGQLVAKTKIKQEAIRAGVAYYTNDVSGSMQFKWKESK